MKVPPLSLFLFFLLLLLGLTCSVVKFYILGAVEALIKVKSELHDPYGVLNNWDEFSVDPCSWTMITCSSDNTVIVL